MPADPEQRLITVCDACLTACCWQAIFFCDQYVSAGIKQMTVAELRRLGREHESYWRTDEKLCGEEPSHA
jgi:epoxyqueuosine reductase QueG